MEATRGDGALAGRIAEYPQVRDREAVGRGWRDLNASAENEAELAAALKKLFTEGSSARALVDAIFSYCPFLTDLAVRDPRRLLRCFTTDPEAHLAALCADVETRLAKSAIMGEAMADLRRFRQELALLVGLSDIGGVWNIDRATLNLSRGAETAVSAATDFLLRAAAARGELTLPDPQRPSKGSGYMVLAMGKLGAGELNYSSDIDLIVFYDGDAAPLKPGLEAARFFVRLTRDLVKLLQERTEDGYVFRVDLRLRPDPGATSIAVSLAAALQYYESMGQNWERAALIKARPVAGDVTAGEALLSELAPFIWRKYFDFAAIADVHAMKRQIHAFKGHGTIAVAGHNIKLGRGGIREIEFFVQTQQLIAGGRQPDLRGGRTLDMLKRLADFDWITEDARDELSQAYRFLRRLEHRLQMRRDEQTHLLPKDPDGLDEVALLCGFAGREAFSAELTRQLSCVERHYAALFEDAPALAGEVGSLVFTGGEDDPDTLQTLARMGFAAPQDVAGAVRSWHFGRYPAVRSEKARERLTELVPGLLKALSETANPQAAFFAFDAFLKGLPAGVQVFSMLRANRELLSLLATIMGSAPRLAAILSHRAHVLDAVLDPDFFGGLPGRETLEEHLDLALGEARGYEDLLDRARRFGQEQAFLIGVRVLSGMVTAGQAGDAYATLAELIVRRLHAAAQGELSAAHGQIAGGASVVLALGKLGGREMTAASDIDLIIVYDFLPGTTQSDGARPVAPFTYYTRLTQRLISALSAPTGEGTLYEVDMRLRPSGHSGPLAASLASFTSYHEESAWTWEHMALTRARVISGDRDLAGKVEAVIGGALRKKRDDETLKQEVVEMRRRIDEEKGSAEPWNLKTTPGGLVDVEFIAQYLQLASAADHPEVLDQNTAEALRKLAAANLLAPGDADILGEACGLYHNLTQVVQLALEGELDLATAPRGLQALLVRTAGVPDIAVLDAQLKDTEARVREVVVGLLGAAPWRERG
ncbi:MAG: bifunctional [glutamine synthetase] adenylyltransferase/[glutamine synthetase]-adenylyl-L-tyrosine phosphorylase [Hyphomicrobiales bacterium]|nr:bifunctional [glutamine synthetase] adenylyltransferase/[glutamine synthetase]-adenylyl-L-tyrosine phosphorylase [Hyphomicrobiales bacterium]